MVVVDDLPGGFATMWIRDRTGKTLYMGKKIIKPKNWLHALYNRILLYGVIEQATIVSRGLFYDNIDHSLELTYFMTDAKPAYYYTRSYFAGSQGYKGIAPWLRWGGEAS